MPDLHWIFGYAWALGLMERDYAAVEAALRLPYSTRPVEGNINRLKLIKRSDYGRAGFDLLRLQGSPDVSGIDHGKWR